MAKFREFKTSSGKRILAGKNAENNEALISQAKSGEMLLHTAKPGSPFVNLKTKKPGKKDIYEAGVFCAKYSQAWKKPKRKPSKIEIHVFGGKDIFKKPKMKLGTFGVKKFKKIIIKKKDILNSEK
jgi:hypothetical protein